MAVSLADRIGLTPARLLALPQDEQHRAVQFLLRWEAFADALSCLDHAPAVDKAAPALRARAWYGLGKIDDALQRLEQVVAQRPEPSLQLTIVEMALNAGRYSLVAAHLQPALDQLRHLSRVWWVAARAYLAIGEVETAQQAVDHLRTQAPASHYRNLSAMALLQAQGDAVTAAAYAVRALAQAEQLDVHELVTLRTFFHAIDDRIHGHAVEAHLVTRLEAEQSLWRGLLITQTAHENRPIRGNGLPFLRSAASSAPKSNAPAGVTVSAEERRALTMDARRFFGFDALLPGQAEILACVGRGEHTLAILPTGAGKSLCYQLPACQREGGLTLVVSPLIALMKDQVDGLPPALRLQSLAINSSLDGDDLRTAMHRIATGQLRLLYAAPERLRQAAFVEALARAGTVRMVVDEAHCVSVWGHDFRPDYLHLRQAHRDLGSPPLLAMTATAPPVVRNDIERQLLGESGKMRVIVGDSFRPNLHLHALRVRDDDERSTQLLRLLRSLQGSGIIYARSRRRCEELAATLQGEGFSAAFYHAGISDRAEVQDRFMRNDVQVIVATVAFGMGIDKRDIRFIVHDGLPSSLEHYYQEIGRAGRDGGSAYCVLLFADHDEQTQLRLASRTPLTTETLHRLYQRVRQSLGERGQGRVPLESLATAVGDTTNARVGLSLLEEAGFLRRGYDTPRTVTLNRPRQMRGQQDAAFMEFAGRCGLDRALTVTGDFVALSEHVGVSPPSLERRLLAWQEERYLVANFDGRDPFIDASSPFPNAAERLATILHNRIALEQQRVDNIARYARTTGCRHSFLADYLGSERITRCNECDNCGAGLPLGSAAPDADGSAALLIILQALAEQSWGRRNLVRLLRGDPAASERARQASLYGALKERGERSLDQLLGSLQHEGIIQPRELQHGGLVLELTQHGVSTMRNLLRQQRRR